MPSQVDLILLAYCVLAGTEDADYIRLGITIQWFVEFFAQHRQN